jgi:two-component system chemotaxis sensor kinase CheA
MENGEHAISTDSETFIVVSQVGAHTFGLIVDKVFDAEEIVVKPVTPMLREIGVYSGNTILGDGSIVMILDMNGIAAATSQVGIASESQSALEAAQGARKDDTVALLVFRSGGRAPNAVPLALVARLEEIEFASVEYSNGQPVVQYRGQLMPLVLVDSDSSISGEGKTPVIVFSDRERSMGLVVDEIIDIVEDKLDIEVTGTRAGIIGSAVVAGKATDIVDAGYYLTQAFADWFSHENDIGHEHTSKRLLLVDDSPFFRNLLAPLLQASGYEVTMAEDGEDALRLLEADDTFDIIVSDIEMPGMDGYELAKACRSDSRWKETPIVALTSHTSPDDLERGHDAGFTDYVGKFDREALLIALSQSLTLVGEAA